MTSVVTCLEPGRRKSMIPAGTLLWSWAGVLEASWSAWADFRGRCIWRYKHFSTHQETSVVPARAVL
jgi:hypothetical protein